MKSKSKAFNWRQFIARTFLIGVFVLILVTGYATIGLDCMFYGFCLTFVLYGFCAMFSWSLENL
jgi:hypothetical protein